MCPNGANGMQVTGVGGPSGTPGPYLGREQRQRSSFASSAAEHHMAPQALLLVVTCRRALPSLSVPPAELKQDIDLSFPAGQPWGLCTAHIGISQGGQAQDLLESSCA